MITIDVDCFRDEYHRVLATVRDEGRKRTPRGRSTLDLGPTTIVVHDPQLPVLPVATGRKVNKAVAAIEALQLVSGHARGDLLVNAAPRFFDFMERDDDGQPSYFHGAYGRRVGDQVLAQVTKLARDPDTRQAVVTLWRPDLDNQPGKRDYPCTVAIGFELADDELSMNVLMRSNDAWLGLAYDAFQFNQLQWTVANALGVGLGRYTHTAWSLHLYEEDLEKLEGVGRARFDAFQPRGIGRVGPNDNATERFRTAQTVAIGLMNGDRYGTPYETSERGDDGWLGWYVDALAPFVG